jgi:hypothetical protein
MNRAEQIAERRAQFPPKYRRIYDRAVEGKSLRACVNAQCLDCVAGQSREIALCTDLALSVVCRSPLQKLRKPLRRGFNGRRIDEPR